MHLLLQTNRLVFDGAIYHGSVERIHCLPTAPSPERLARLVHGQQIIATGNGQTVAVIELNARQKEVLSHSRIPLVPVEFEPASDWPPNQGTHVLHVTDQSVLVWGKPTNTRQRGVYRLSVEGCYFLEPLDWLDRVHHAQDTVVVIGRSASDEVGVMRAITPFGTLRLSDDSVIAPLLNGSIQIVQHLCTGWYSYLVGPKGFTHVRPLITRAQERVIAMVQMQGSKVFCLSGETESRFIAMRKRSHGPPLQQTFVFSGCLECVWQSPSGCSIAWLVRRFEQGHMQRSLFLNGRLVHRGPFGMGYKDVRWSPSEQELAALVTLKASSHCQQIVTCAERIVVAEHSVHDFLVNDQGRIVATLRLEDGVYVPYIQGVPNDGVMFAWNLHWSGNTARYNSVHLRSVRCHSTACDLPPPTIKTEH